MTDGPRVHGGLAEVLELAPGAKGDVFALVRSCRLGRYGQADKPYGDIVLADREHTVAARLWAGDPQQNRMLLDLLSMRPETPVKVRFEVTEYRGQLQLKIAAIRPTAETDVDAGFEAARLFGEDPAWLAGRKCRTLVFDIETVPDAGIRDMPPTIVKALTEFAKRKDIDESAVRGLSPFFAKIVSLAFGEGEADDAEPAPITALVVPRPEDDSASLPEWAIPMDEIELLRAFWRLAAAAELVVTYNGRGFDVPFLVARSLMRGVPAPVDLLSNRFSLKPHLDLLEVLGQRGRGPSNLDVVCWALGIESPKGAMDGSMVAPAYASGRIADIAAYNRQDVRATAEVYRRTRDGVLRFRSDWS